jgi:hypothetical protein
MSTRMSNFQFYLSFPFHGRLLETRLYPDLPISSNHTLGTKYIQYLYNTRKVRPRHIPAVKFETQTIPRRPCSDGREARILVRLLMHPSRQAYPSSANFISKFMMSANFVRNSANLSSLSTSCQQFSKSVACKQIVSAIQQICIL